VKAKVVALRGMGELEGLIGGDEAADNNTRKAKEEGGKKTHLGWD
jgi:hypothetical protein